MESGEGGWEAGMRVGGSGLKVGGWELREEELILQRKGIWVVP